MITKLNYHKALTTILLLAALVALFAWSTDKAYADDDTVTISIEGTYGQTEARSMLDMVNDFRTGKYIDGDQSAVWARNESNEIDTASYQNLGELQYDYELEKTAMLRAMEIAVYNEHTRPNGTNCYTAFPDGYSARGENIACSTGSQQNPTQFAFDDWREETDNYYGQGHRRNMLGSNYNRIGIAHVIIHYSGLLDEGDRDYNYVTDIHYWVQEFGRRDDTFGLTETTAKNSNTCCDVEILRNLLQKTTLSSEDESLSVSVGDSTQFNGATCQFRLTETWPTIFTLRWSDGKISKGTYLIPAVNGYTISLADPTIASVSGNTITGNNVGSTTLNITSTLDSTVTATLPVTVEASSLSSATVTVPEPYYVYSGAAQTPDPTVTLNGNNLKKGTDFTVSYENNLTPGTATITVTGQGDYQGTVTGTFKILPKPLNNTATDITVNDIPDQAYTGEEVKPSVTIKDGDTTLKKGIDYSLSYSSNINAGNNAVVNIEGIGNYKTGSIVLEDGEYVVSPGVFQKNFTITPKPVTADMINLSEESFVYNGNLQKPEVTVTDGDKAVSADITNDGGIDAGTYTVTVTGTGNYGQTAVREYQIVKPADPQPPADTTGDKSDTSGDKSGTSGDKSDTTGDKSDTSGDKSGTSDDKSGTSGDKSGSSTSKSDTSDKSGSTDSQSKDSGKPADSADSVNAADSADAALATVKAVNSRILKLKSDGDLKGAAFLALMPKSKKQTRNAITLSWKKASGASYYLVYGALSGKNKKYKKLKQVKGTSFQQKKLKKGTYYKYMIVAVKKTSSGDRVLSVSSVIHVATKGGKASNPTSITIKKPKKGKVTVKRKKTTKITASVVGKNVKKRLGLRFESSNPAVAMVSAKGVAKGKKKGKAFIYVIAQNGLYKKVTVNVR